MYFYSIWSLVDSQTLVSVKCSTFIGQIKIELTSRSPLPFRDSGAFDAREHLLMITLCSCPVRFRLMNPDLN